MKEIVRNWTVWRALRLILGAAVIHEAGLNDSFALYLLGGFLFMHALLNLRCSASGCNTVPEENGRKDLPVIDIQELDLNNKD